MCFSVVIPSRNEEELLGAILHGLRKLFGEAEIIVVDDGATDETGKIVQDYKASRPKQP